MMVPASRGRILAFVASLVFLLVLMGTFVAACGGDDELPSPGGGALSGTLNGAGATFPEPLYIEWIGEFQSANADVSINYQGIGSGGGIEQFTKMTVDFGASDAPMKDEEITTAEMASGAKVLHIPTVFGAVVASYNLEGVDELQLDAETLAGIFLGTITQWNDPKIVATNPGATLPDEDIQVVHRSDSSGTTNIFTSYLSQVSPDWESAVGSGKEANWPVGVGGQGNDGVAAVIQQQPGTIGYVELSYAIESNLAMASLKNKAGNFITPSLESTSAAAQGTTFPEDLRFSVADSAGAEAYPIVGATWILAYDKMQDSAKAEALKAWLMWSLNEGTAIAEELGYAPLPDDLKALALAKVNAINAE